MADNYLDKLDKVMSKPVIPEKVVGEKLSQPVAFPDADATEEEIADFLNDRKEDE